jgi:hypothetical protein
LGDVFQDWASLALRKSRRESWEKTRLRAAFPDSETNQFLWVDGPSAKPKAGDSGTRKSGKGLKQGSFLTAVAKQTTVQAKHCQHVFALFNRLLYGLLDQESLLRGG